MRAKGATHARKAMRYDMIKKCAGALALRACRCAGPVCEVEDGRRSLRKRGGRYKTESPHRCTHATIGSTWVVCRRRQAFAPCSAAA